MAEFSVLAKYISRLSNLELIHVHVSVPESLFLRLSRNSASRNQDLQIDQNMQILSTRPPSGPSDAFTDSDSDLGASIAILQLHLAIQPDIQSLSFEAAAVALPRAI